MNTSPVQDTKTISVTDFRKKLFEIANDIFFHRTQYVVVKNSIPLFVASPVGADVKIEFPTKIESSIKKEPVENIKQTVAPQPETKPAQDNSTVTPEEERMLSLLLKKLRGS